VSFGALRALFIMNGSLLRRLQLFEYDLVMFRDL